MSSLPNPANYEKNLEGLRLWAEALYKDIDRSRNDPSSDYTSPKPILLSRFTSISKATTSGILLFDSATDTVVLSVDGEWKYYVPSENANGSVMKWRGNYSVSATYHTGDVVKDGTTIAVALVETTDSPTTTPADWEVLE